MPGMLGAGLAAELKKLNKHFRIILVSAD